MPESRNSSPSLQTDNRLELEIKGVMVAFRYCPPGKFLMGSPEDEVYRDDGEIQHEVILTRGFWLGETQVTQRLWKAVEDGENQSFFRGLDARPAEKVSWYDCHAFVEKLNSLGAAPMGMKFDFPTEAEWEYACRAETTTPFNFGSQLNGDNVNCFIDYPYGTSTEEDFIGETVPVRSYAPNAWGLYDMHGNVLEWCKDWFGDYPTGSVTNPTGPTSGFDRIMRGGSWSYYAENCRSAARSSYSPSHSGDNVGLRLALRSVK